MNCRAAGYRGISEAEADDILREEAEAKALKRGNIAPRRFIIYMDNVFSKLLIRVPTGVCAWFVKQLNAGSYVIPAGSYVIFYVSHNSFGMHVEIIMCAIIYILWIRNAIKTFYY